MPARLPLSDPEPVPVPGAWADADTDTEADGDTDAAPRPPRLIAALALACAACATAGGPSAAAGVSPATAEAFSPPPPRALAFSPDGKLLASGGDGAALLWRTETQARWRDLACGRGPATVVAFSADGALLFCASSDGSVTARDVELDQVRWSVPAPPGAPAAAVGLALVGGGQGLLAAFADGRIEQWDAQRGTPQRSLRAEAPPLALAVSEGGALLALGGRAEAARPAPAVWDVATGKLLRRLAGLAGDSSAVAFAPQGQLLAAGGPAGVFLYNARDGELTVSLPDAPKQARAVAFRPDGLLLAAGSDEGELVVWDVRSRTPLLRAGRSRMTAGAPPGIAALAFHPQGLLLASLGHGGSVDFWDAAAFAEPLPAPEAEAACAALQPRVDAWARDPEKAAESLVRIQDLAARFPKAACAHLLLGQALFLSSRDFAPLRAELSKALALEPEHQATLSLASLLEYQTKHYDEALPLLERLIQVAPNSTTPLQLRGGIATAAKKPEEAAPFFERALLLEPGNVVNAYNFACAEALRGKSESALLWLERSFQGGYRSFDNLKHDPDLESLRGLPKYAELITRYSGGSATAATSGQPARADALREQGDGARKQDRCAEALPLYQQAIAEERATPEPRDGKLRRDLLWLGYCAKTEGQPKLALQAFEESVAVSDRAGSRDDDVSAMGRTLLGGMQLQAQQFAQARATFETVLPVLRARGDQELLATTLRNLARAEAAIGYAEKALELLREARALLEKELAAKPDDPGLVNNLLQVHGAAASVLSDRGQTKAAMEEVQAQLALARAKGTPRDLLDALSALAIAWLGEKRFDESVKAWQEYLDLARAQGRPRQVTLGLNGLSAVYQRMGRLAEARELSDEALARAREGGEGLHATLLAASQLREKAGDEAGGIALLEEDLQLQRKGGDEEEIARSLRFLADALPEARAAQALALQAEALALYRKRLDRPAEAQLLKDQGLLYYRLERWDEAAARLSESVLLLEQFRAEAKGEARRDLIKRQAQTYHLLTLARLRTRDTPGALRASELARDRLLAERIAGAGEVAPPQLAELPELAGDGAILVISDAGIGLPVSFAVDAEGMQGWPKQLPLALLAELEALGAKRVKDDPLGAAVEAFRALLESPKQEAQARKLGQLLWDALIAPSEKYLRSGAPLVIVPDGPLWALPWDALRDPAGRLLGERFSVRLAPSLTALLQLRARRGGRAPPQLVQSAGEASEALAAGATELVLQLWPQPAGTAEAFLREVQARSAAGSVAEAVTATRRSWAGGGEGKANQALQRWAGFAYVGR